MRGMEHVVYVLGAGFSAPLGLPVIRNFLLRAKDIYFSNTTQYGYFSDVFKRIDDLARLKNVFAADLLNIEEILSILQMDGEFAKGGVEREKFERLIKDVVIATTPKLGGPPNRPNNWAPFA